MAMIDGVPGASLPVDDRGLAYGDGLFETIRFVAGQAPLWRRHMRRLALGCRRLGLPAPDDARLLDEAGRLVGDDDAVVKLVLTRCGGRGYSPMSPAAVRRILMRFPVPTPLARRSGLRLRWCRLRLSGQPRLAGMKHLNRLEQVLARSEWRDPRIHEGLLRDQDGRVISATAANLFLVHDGRLLTPRLDRCGVAGVARAFLVARARRWLPVLETDLSVADVESADELFLSNAVRGVMPVARLGTVAFRPGPVTRRLGYTLSTLGIGTIPDDANG